MPRPLSHAVRAATAGQPDAVRDHILDAAHRVITTHGLTAASTRAIAQEAGISVGTLYNYFGDRYELLASSMLRRAHVLSRRLTELPALAGRATVAANLHRFAREIGAILDDLVPLFAAAFADTELLRAIRQAAATDASGAGPFAGHPVEDYLRAERDLGRVAPDADLSAAASLVLSLCHDRAFHKFFRGTTRGLSPTAGETDLIARAITAPLEPEHSDADHRTPPED